VGIFVNKWLNLSEQKRVNLSERYRNKAAILILKERKIFKAMQTHLKAEDKIRREEKKIRGEAGRA